jgi:hypothetical protein
MYRTTDPPPRTDAGSTRRVVAGLATIATTVTVAAIGPGVALAQALAGRNHNEVMARRRADRT